MVRFLSAEKDNENKEDFYSIAAIVLISSFIISALLFLLSNDVAHVLFNGDVNLVRNNKYRYKAYPNGYRVCFGPLVSEFANLWDKD